MKLYEINAGLRALVEGTLDQIVDMETGEVFTAKNIENLELARAEKIEGCAVVYKEIKSEAEALAAEIKNLGERKATLENKLKFLAGYIDEALQGTAFKTAKAQISYKLTKRVEVTCDAESLPKEYQRITCVPDKMALKGAIKDGAEIPGVELVESRSMSIK